MNKLGFQVIGMVSFCLLAALVGFGFFANQGSFKTACATRWDINPEEFSGEPLSGETLKQWVSEKIVNNEVETTYSLISSNDMDAVLRSIFELDEPDKKHSCSLLLMSPEYSVDQQTPYRVLLGKGQVWIAAATMDEFESWKLDPGDVSWKTELELEKTFFDLF